MMVNCDYCRRHNGLRILRGSWPSRFVLKGLKKRFEKLEAGRCPIIEELCQLDRLVRNVTGEVAIFRTPK